MHRKIKGMWEHTGNTADTDNHSETERRWKHKTFTIKQVTRYKWRRDRREGTKERGMRQRHDGLGKQDGIKHKAGKQGTRTHTTV